MYVMTQSWPVQEATREAEGADLKLQVSACQQQIQQLLSAVSGKDATVAEARQKLDGLTQQLASHERQSEQAAAATEGVIAGLSQRLQAAESAQAGLVKQLQETESDREAAASELTKQLREAEADRETAVSELTRQAQTAEADREAAELELTKQLQEAKANRETAVLELTKQLQAAEQALQSSSTTKDVEIEDLKRQLASSKAERPSTMTTQAAELVDLTQQLQASQLNLSELAERAAGMEGQLTERSKELTKHQALVKQLQAAESASQARLLALTELSSEQVSALCHRASLTKLELSQELSLTAEHVLTMYTSLRLTPRVKWASQMQRLQILRLASPVVDLQQNSILYHFQEMCIKPNAWELAASKPGPSLLYTASKAGLMTNAHMYCSRQRNKTGCSTH